MPDTKQKLGIELSLNLDSKFKDLIKEIESAFANVNIKGLEAQIKGVESSVSGAEVKISKLAREIANLTKGNAQQIQLDINTSNLNKKMVDATTKIRNFKEVTVKSNGEIVSSVKAIKEAADAFYGKTGKGTQFSTLREELREIRRAAKEAFNERLAQAKAIKQAEKEAADAFYGKDGKGNQTSTLKQDLKEIQQASKDSVKDFKKTKDSSVDLTTSLGKMAKALLEFYTIRSVIFAVRNQLTSAVKDIVGFNQALADTAAISNASDESMRKFGESASMIARNSKMDYQEVMKLTNLLAQSGVSAKDVPMVGKITAMFATGTGSSVENAVRVMTTSLNVWNIEASKASVVADTLTAGLNSAKLEVNELSTVFNYLAPMARQAGYSIQQTTAIIATMSQMGVKASTIGTGVGQSLTRLMAPTKGVKDLAEAYGLSLDQLNPRLHKFSEIIKTLQTADNGLAIPVQDLLRAFGQIAGRSISAAVTAGSEYFEQMERNVSLGNASLVAYSKTMEGAGAKINVLRQSFVQLIGSITSVNSVIWLGYDYMLAMVRGLTSIEGKVTISIVALASLAAAIRAFKTEIIAFVASNPLTVWATVIGLALSGILAYLGRVSSEVKGMANEHDQLAKKMGGAQRAFQSLTEMYGKAAQAGTLNNDITREHKEEIEKLVRTTPSLHGVIDTSVKKYGQLATSIKNVNNQMEALSDNNLNAYNKMVDQLEKLKSNRGFLGLGMSYNDQIKHAESVRTSSMANTSGDPKKVQEVNDRYNEALTDIADKFKSDPSVRKLIDTMLIKQASISYGNPVDPLKNDPESLLVSKYVKAPPPVSPPSNTNPYPTDGIGDKNGHGGTITGIDMADANRKWNNEIYSEMQRNTLTTLENEVKADIESLKKETDPDAYSQGKAALEAKINKLEEETLKAYTEQLYSKMAGVVGAEYDPSKKKPFQFPNTDEGKLNFENYTKYVNENPTAFMDYFRKGIESKGFVTASGTDVKTLKVPAFKADKLSKDTTLKDEVVEGRRLAKLQEELAVRKAHAATTKELEDLDMEGMHNQEESALKLKKLYSDRLDQVKKEKDLFKTPEDYETALKTAEDNLAAIEVKLTGINSQMNEASKSDFLSIFEAGAKKAAISMGSFKSNTAALGEAISSTALNGMVNLLDQSIGKLAELKWSWKDFAKTLGGVMKDIAAELQKYLAKMLVVWAMEKMIGMFATGSSSNFNNTPSGADMPAFNSSPSMFTDGSWYAEGGVVTGGIQGVDSVPIMAMPEEYVVKSSVVRSLGVDFMDALNSGKVKRFASGGLVGGGSVRASSSDSEATIATIQIVNVVDPESIPQPTASQIVNVISFDIAKKGSTYKTIKMALS